MLFRGDLEKPCPSRLTDHRNKLDLPLRETTHLADARRHRPKSIVPPGAVTSGGHEEAESSAFSHSPEQVIQNRFGYCRGNGTPCGCLDKPHSRVIPALSSARPKFLSLPSSTYKSSEQRGTREVYGDRLLKSSCADKIQLDGQLS